MDIDYHYSDLPENEIAEHMERRRRETVSEAQKDKARRIKMNNFRFQGGML